MTANQARILEDIDNQAQPGEPLIVAADTGYDRGMYGNETVTGQINTTRLSRAFGSKWKWRGSSGSRLHQESMAICPKFVPLVEQIGENLD